MLSGNEDRLVKDAETLVYKIQFLVGIVPASGEAPISYWRRIYSILASILLAGTFVYIGQFSQAMHLLHVFPEKLLTFQSLNCITTTCVPFSKFVFMWLSRNQLKPIFEMMQQSLSSLPQGSPAKEVMTKMLQKSRYLSLLVIINQFLVHFVYLAVPLVFTIFGNDRYLPTTPGVAYGLNGSKESPNYEIAFVVAILATYFSAINQTAYIVLFVTIIASEIGQFNAITEILRQTRGILYDETRAHQVKQKAVQENLVFCIKRHQFLQRFHEVAKQLYKFIFATHFFMMTIVLITTLQTYNSWNLVNSILTGVTGILPLLLYCFGGELLIAASLKTSFAVYDCGWEKMDQKHARIVLFMLRATQKPLLLTAAGIFVMNRETFAAIAQIIYKVCAVFDN